MCSSIIRKQCDLQSFCAAVNNAAIWSKRTEYSTFGRTSQLPLPRFPRVLPGYYWRPSVPCIRPRTNQPLPQQKILWYLQETTRHSRRTATHPLTSDHVIRISRVRALSHSERRHHHHSRSKTGYYIQYDSHGNFSRAHLEFALHERAPTTGVQGT